MLIILGEKAEDTFEIQEDDTLFETIKKLKIREGKQRISVTKIFYKFYIKSITSFLFFYHRKYMFLIFHLQSSEKGTLLL